MLTASQATALMVAAKADSALTAARASNDDRFIADYYNTTPASPVLVWRPSISQTEINTAIVAAEFVVLTALQQNLLMLLLMGPVDATSPNVQTSFTTIFGSGTATRANLIAIAKRAATRFEALFVTSGVSSVFGHVLTASEVGYALRNDDGSAK